MMTGTKKRFTGAIVLVAAMMVALILGSVPAFASDTEAETKYTFKEVPADELQEFLEAFCSDDWSTGYVSDFVKLTHDEAWDLKIYSGFEFPSDTDSYFVYNYQDYDGRWMDGILCQLSGGGMYDQMKVDEIDTETVNRHFYYPVLASESTEEDTDEQGNTAASTGNEYTLTRTVASSDTPYTWTIPTAIDWAAVGGEGNEGLYKCSVDFQIAPSSGEAYIILEDGKSLQLTVSSGNGWKLEGTNNNELAYTATKDGASTAIANGDAIFDVASGSNDASGQTVKVNFATTDAAKIADTYTDTLTFTSGIVDTPAAESAE